MKKSKIPAALEKDFDLRPGAPLKFLNQKHGIVDLNTVTVDQARRMYPDLNGKLIPKFREESKKEEPKKADDTKK